MGDIYAEIKADHDHHRKLIETIQDTTGATEDRKAAWAEFFHHVKTHAAAEEETFYSKLISKTWGQDAARHSVAEHKELDDLMEELEGMDMASSGWLNRFNTLAHDYLHHIDEEEDELFTRAREVIPENEIAGYGKRFLERKEEEAKIVEEKREDHLED